MRDSTFTRGLASQCRCGVVGYEYEQRHVRRSRARRASGIVGHVVRGQIPQLPRKWPYLTPVTTNVVRSSVRKVDSKRFAYRTGCRRSAFRDHFSGYPPHMPDSDEVPIADALEQQQDAVAPASDDEAPAAPPADVPLEASDADWQEQLEEVVIDDPEERADD